MPGLQNRAPASSKPPDGVIWRPDEVICPTLLSEGVTVRNSLQMQQPGLQNREPASAKPHKPESRMESSHGRIPLPNVAFCSCNKKSINSNSSKCSSRASKTLLPFFIRRRTLFPAHLALLLRRAPPCSLGSADICLHCFYIFVFFWINVCIYF